MILAPLVPVLAAATVVVVGQIDPVTEGWVQYGVLGLLVVAFMMEWIVTGKALTNERQRGDRLEAENARIRDNVESKIIPLVTRSIDALREHPHTGGGDSDGPV